MRCRYRGTCCPTRTTVTTTLNYTTPMSTTINLNDTTPSPTTTTLNDSKPYKIVIAVILPCIFILVLACAIYLLRGAKKRPKLCGLQKFDISSKSIGEKNGDLEYDKPRVYQVSEDCDEVPC